MYSWIYWQNTLTLKFLQQRCLNHFGSQIQQYISHDVLQWNSTLKPNTITMFVGFVITKKWDCTPTSLTNCFGGPCEYCMEETYKVHYVQLSYPQPYANLQLDKWMGLITLQNQIHQASAVKDQEAQCTTYVQNIYKPNQVFNSCLLHIYRFESYLIILS